MAQGRDHQLIAPSGEGERQLAALSYVLTWLSGLLVLILAKRENRYARWHAIQAIGLGVVAVMLLSLAALLEFTLLLLWSLAFGEPAWTPGFDPLPFPFVFRFGGLSALGNLVVLAVALWFALKAYKDERVRIPVISQFADDNA